MKSTLIISVITALGIGIGLMLGGWQWLVTCFQPPATASTMPLDDGSAIVDARDRGNLRLLILAGQSNMSGRAASSAEDNQPLQHVYIFGNNYRWRPAQSPVDDPIDQVDAVSLDQSPGFAPDIPLARRLCETLPESTWGLVPCAKGASTIGQWQRDLSDQTLYGSMLKRVQAASKLGRPTALIFIQGEGDTREHNGISPHQWAGLFVRMINDLRSDLHQPDLPVIFAQLTNPPPDVNSPHWQTVQQQQKLAATQLNRAVMIPTTDLTTFDGIHFDHPSNQILGARIADALIPFLQDGDTSESTSSP